LPSALLESAGVYFAAIWLNSAKDDILVPLYQPPAGLQENKPYTDEQVISALSKIAQQALAFDKSRLDVNRSLSADKQRRSRHIIFLVTRVRI